MSAASTPLSEKPLSMRPLAKSDLPCGAVVEPNAAHAPKKRSVIHELFRRFASHAAVSMGSSTAFGAAVVLLLVWAASYPLFRLLPNPFDTWQLVINTATTIITFLMVFLIQNSQNRDSRAVHLKLDELIRAMQGARNRLVDLENCTDAELEKLQVEFSKLRKQRDEDGDQSENRPETNKAV